MKLKQLTTTMMATLLLPLLALTACNGDGGLVPTPKKPTDETRNKLHDDPTKLIIQLFEVGTEPINSLVLEQSNEWKGPILEVEAGKEYHLWVRYYNKAGTEITGQFATNGQEKIHQHFFISSKGDIRDYMAYRYADTDPWNKTTEQGAQLLTANPIGLKGIVSFTKSGITFPVKMRLLHDYSGDKRLRDDDKKTGLKVGDFAPWYYVPRQKANQGWDINVDFEITVK